MSADLTTLVRAALYGVAFAAAGCTRARPTSSWPLAIFPLFLLGVLVSLSRNALDTGDLPVYAEGFSDDEWSLYYLREAPFWLLGRILTDWTGNVRSTFFLLDVLLVLLAQWAFRRRGGLQLTILLFAFPSVLGFTNIYRQLFASLLAMVALSQLDRRPWRAWLMLLFSCSIHIAFVGVVLALLFASTLIKGRRHWLIIVAPLLVLSVSLVQLDVTFMDITGGTESRGNTGPLYIALGIILHAICWMTLKGDPASRRRHFALIIYFLGGAASLAFAPDSTGTRVMMISIHLSAFLALSRMSQVKDRNGAYWAAALAALLTFPILVSDSAWHLIFGYELA